MLKKSLLLLLSFLFVAIYLFTNTNVTQASNDQFAIFYETHLSKEAERIKQIALKENYTVKMLSINEVLDKNKNETDQCLQLKNSIINLYKENQTKYVLLLGETFPFMTLYPFGSENKLKGTSAIISDLFFSDITTDWDKDKDSHFGEIEDDYLDPVFSVSVGRLPFSDPIIINNYCDRIESYFSSSANNNVLVASGYQQFESLGANSCIENSIDLSVTGQKVSAIISNSFTPHHMYNSSGIKSSKHIYESDTCLNSDALIDTLNTLQPSFAFLGFCGDGKSLYHKLWGKDENQNSYADSNEVYEETLLDETNVVKLKSNTCFFAYPAASMKNESDFNISKAILSGSGLAFCGQSMFLEDLQNSKYSEDIFLKWINLYSSFNSIGDSLIQIVNDVKYTTIHEKEMYFFSFFSLSYIGLPIVKIKNTVKPKLIQMLSPVKQKNALPNEPKVLNVTSKRKIFSNKIEQFTLAHQANGYRFTKDGGFIIASSSSSQKNGKVFTVKKFNQKGILEWEFVPILKNIGIKSDTGYGGAFDVAERNELGGYLVVGYLEQTSINGKDDDICFFILDDNGNELYRNYYGTMDFRSIDVDDYALNILTLGNNEFIVSGFHKMGSNQYMLYIGHLSPNGAVLKHCNRAVIIKGLDESYFSGSQPYTIIRQIDADKLLMLIPDYNILIITNLDFEEVIMKVSFDYNKYNMPNIDFLDKSNNNISPELKGKAIFSFKNTLFSLSPRGENNTEGVVKPLVSFPGCVQIVMVKYQNDGIYLLLLNEGKFTLLKYDLNMLYLWKISLNDFYKMYSYEPEYNFESLKYFPYLLYFEDNYLFLSNILAKEIGKNDFYITSIKFDLPMELKKAFLLKPSKYIYRLSSIKMDANINFHLRISNGGNEELYYTIKSNFDDIKFEDNSVSILKFGHQNIVINIDGSIFKPGKYEREIMVNNLKKKDDNIYFKILFEIRDIDPKLTISTTSIDFGDIEKSESKTEKITFSNEGGGSLQISIIQDYEWLNIDKNSFILQKSSSETIFVTVNFQEKVIGNVDGNIIVKSNDVEIANIFYKVFFKHRKPNMLIYSESEFFKSDEFNYGIIKKPSKIEDSIFIKNTGDALLTGNYEISDASVKVIVQEESSFSLNENEIKEIGFVIDSNELKPDHYEVKMTIQTNDGNKQINFIWILTPPLPIIEKTHFLIPSLTQGKNSDISVKIQNIEGHQHINLQTNTDWIILPENEINLSNQEYEVQIKISSKNLPIGTHKSTLDFIFNFEEEEKETIELGVISVFIEINVVSNETIIQLWIGKNTAIVNNIPKLIDPNDLSIVPVIKKNTTLVPIRFISETYNASVEWNAKIEMVTIFLKEKKLQIILYVNKEKAYINGRETKLSVPPMIINKRVFVPLRFISEAFGAEVKWDGAEQKITIKMVL